MYAITKLSMNFLYGNSLCLILVIYATLFPITNWLHNRECSMPVINNCAPIYACNLNTVVNLATDIWLILTVTCQHLLKIHIVMYENSLKWVDYLEFYQDFKKYFKKMFGMLSNVMMSFTWNSYFNMIVFCAFFLMKKKTKGVPLSKSCYNK